MRLLIFAKYKSTHTNFELEKTLLGIVVDWSEAEMTLEFLWERNSIAINLLKSCKVRWHHLL